MKRLRQILHESYRLLLEYDLEKTIKQHGDKALKVALARDEHDSYLDDVHGLYHGYKINTNPGNNHQKAMHELMGQFEEADPTPNKKYVQHIARIYGAGGFNRHEDVFSRGKSAIRDFHDLSTRKILPADKRDMGQYKSLSQIEDVVDAHKEKTSGKQEDKAQHEKMKSQATITDHNLEYPENAYTHIIPHTAEAAAHFGKGTRWCTAATDDADEQERTFHEYHRDGPLQIFVPHKASYPGEKYQYHYSTGQLMDEKDNPLSLPGEENKYAPHNIEHEGILNHISVYRDIANQAAKSRAGLSHPELEVRRKALFGAKDITHEDLYNAATKDFDKFHNDTHDDHEHVYSHPKWDDSLTDRVIDQGTDHDLDRLVYDNMHNNRLNGTPDKMSEARVARLLTRQFPDGSPPPWKGYKAKWPDALASHAKLTPSQRVMAAKGEGHFANQGGFGHRNDLSDSDIQMIKDSGSDSVKRYFLSGGYRQVVSKHAKHFLDDPSDNVKLAALHSAHIHSKDKMAALDRHPGLEEKYKKQTPYAFRSGHPEHYWKENDKRNFPDDPRTEGNEKKVKTPRNNEITWHGRR